MKSNTELLNKISELADRDGRYKKEAYLFILAALEYTVSQLSERRHLTGQELSVGIAGYARDQYGYLAQTVLENWGLKATIDFGEIVYRLIDIHVMSKTEQDRKEDFADVFEFDDEFHWPRTSGDELPDRL